MRRPDDEDIDDLCSEYEDERTSVLWLDQSREKILHIKNFDPDIELFPRPDAASAPKRIKELQSMGFEVCLLQPVDHDSLSAYKGGSDRGYDFSSLVVICYMQAHQTKSDGESIPSNPEEPPVKQEKWKWDGVYEWEGESGYYRNWQLEEILLV